MKDLFLHHPWINTSGKGLLGSTVPLAMLKWAAVGAVWQSLAAMIAAAVLVITFVNVILEFLHRWRREQRERDEGW